MIIIFLGPPGSGKGTQAQYISRETTALHVSTGDLLREKAREGGPLSEKIKQALEKGSFISDEPVIELVEQFVSHHKGVPLIFDGFPRTLNQALAFDALLGVHDLKVDFVAALKLDPEQLLERVAGRCGCLTCGAIYHKVTQQPRLAGVCDVCGGKQFRKREDDSAEVLKKRVQVYMEETLPLEEFYSRKRVLKVFNASRNAGEIRQEIKEDLSQLGLKFKGE